MQILIFVCICSAGLNWNKYANERKNDACNQTSPYIFPFPHRWQPTTRRRPSKEALLRGMWRTSRTAGERRWSRGRKEAVVAACVVHVPSPRACVRPSGERGQATKRGGRIPYVVVRTWYFAGARGVPLESFFLAPDVKGWIQPASPL